MRVAFPRAPLLVIALMAACARDPAEPGATAMVQATRPRDAAPERAEGAPRLPIPPLDLVAPPAPEPSAAERAVSRASAASLLAGARRAAFSGDLPGAMRRADSSVAKGGRGQYLLARGHGRLGHVDLSFYWLQRAALEEGVDPAAVAIEPDLASVRSDPRWPAVAEFLRRASAYWAANGSASVVVITPKSWRARTLPVLVGLHEDGDAPEDFLEQDAYRRRAERLGVMFVGLSGTVPLGPKTYRWSVDPEENARHVATWLARLPGHARARVGQDRVILLGFGEGAQAALEVATRAPDRYRGAIAMSPRGVDWHLGEGPAQAEHSRQGYVIAFASFESFDAVGTSYVDASLLRNMGTRVQTHVAWVYAKHALPPDYDVRLRHWIGFVLDAPPGMSKRP